MHMNNQTSTRELYRNRDNSPLDRLQIRRVAPSVSADREDDSRSEKYRFVSSDSLLDQMEEAGFLVVGAQEQRTRKPDGTPTRKHLIRFAHRDVLERTQDERIEVVMINSHNGSCSYQLMAGIFRLVCTNGLIVGARIAAINIRHMGHTGEEVIAASLRLASETPRIMDNIHRMQGVELLTSDRWISFMMRPGCAWETTTKTGYVPKLFCRPGAGTISALRREVWLPSGSASTGFRKT